MRLENLKRSFDVLANALPPRIELGMPWPQDQGYDDYESPALIFEATQELGGQAFLSGDAAHMEEFLRLSGALAEPRVIGFWLRYATFYSNDGGVGIQRLVGGWESSQDPLKHYLASHVNDLVETG